MNKFINEFVTENYETVTQILSNCRWEWEQYWRSCLYKSTI